MRKIIKPANGRRVREPDGALLPNAGKEVTWGLFWEKRLRDGDVIVIGAQESQPAQLQEQPATPTTTGE